MIDPLLGWIAVACIATLFVHAAIAKWIDLPRFEQHLAAYGVDRPAAVRAIPLAELLVGVSVVTPWRVPAACGAAALLLLYAAAMANALVRGRRLDCGCGGAPLPVSWALVIRNLGLAALSAIVVLPTEPRALSLADFLVVAAALLLATLLYAAFNQVLRHRAGPVDLSWKG